MTVTVTDSFEIRAGMTGIKHAPGVVMVFDASNASHIPRVGATVHLRRPGGHGFDVVIGEVKEHGPARSFYFEGLKLADAPIGSTLSWADVKATKSVSGGVAK